MQRYLKGLEKWLNKWRLKIAPHKCSFNIYRGNVPNLNELPNRSLTIFSEKIDKNPKYQGVSMDKTLATRTTLVKSKPNATSSSTSLKAYPTRAGCWILTNNL